MAAGDLIAVADVKTRLQITFSTDDALLQQAITGCSAFIEKRCQRSFSAVLSKSDVLDGGGESLILKSRPAVAVMAVTDRLSGDAVDSSVYELDGDEGIIYPLLPAPVTVSVPAGLFEYSQNLPRWGAGRRRWQIDYTAGFASVPADVQELALRIVTALYDHRDELESEHMGDTAYAIAHGKLTNLAPMIEEISLRYQPDMVG
jgi:Phage gp6-like head-tail connector protein